MTSAGLEVRPVTEEQRPELTKLLEREWGTIKIVSRGEVHDLSRCSALFCVEHGGVVGIATYEITGKDCELLTIDAFEKRRGIGSRLLGAVAERARAAGCRRLWLVTTNDNLDAIRFYQRRGMRLVAVFPTAVDEARRIKPQIPLVGEYGIPIRDELEFELALEDQASASSDC
jgi:ribosomal protein S18 acetylase RimI-like enzyme